MTFTPNQAAQIYWALNYYKSAFQRHMMAYDNGGDGLRNPTTGVFAEFRFNLEEIDQLMEHFRALCTHPTTGVEKGLFDGVKGLLMEYADSLFSGEGNPNPNEYTSAIINQLLAGLWLQAQMEGAQHISTDWLLTKRDTAGQRLIRAAKEAREIIANQAETSQ